MGLQFAKIIGKRVEKKTIYDSEIRDTTTIMVQVNTSDYTDFKLIATNTLDQPVTLAVYASEGFTLFIWDGEDYVSAITNPATLRLPGQYPLMEHPAFALVKEKGMVNFNIRVKCTSAPTTGSLKIEVHGRLI